MTTRLYVPATFRGLQALAAERQFVPEPGAEPVVAEGDDEESEYAALMTAADLSTALAGEAGVPGLRRVVVVVESSAAEAETGALAGALPDSVPLRDVVALHLDTEDRGPDDDPDDDLAWFTTDELADLF